MTAPGLRKCAGLVASWGVEMSANTKSWWQSKTIWINAITAATATLTVLGGQQIVTDHPAIAASLVAALGGLNIVLRIITVLPIGGE
jgi:hypothetical protein